MDQKSTEGPIKTTNVNLTTSQTVEWFLFLIFLVVMAFIGICTVAQWVVSKA